MFLTNEKYFISNLSKTWENLRPLFPNLDIKCNFVLKTKGFETSKKSFWQNLFFSKKNFEFSHVFDNEKYFISNLSKTWENLRPVFSTKKKIQNHGKKEDM